MSPDLHTCLINGRSTDNRTSFLSDVAYFPVYNAPVLGKPSIPYQSPTPFNLTGDYTLYFTSPDGTSKNDACTALPSSTPNLTNKVVVVQRGTCDFNVKIANVAKAGG